MAKKIIFLLIVLQALVGCGGGNRDSNKNTQFSKNSLLDLSSGNYECLKMITSSGDIFLALDKVRAPITTKNYLTYSAAGFYEGTLFHRVIDGFMIQGGGFDETLTKKTTNAAIINEADNGLMNIRGSIAMARTSEPQSATSQFFINTDNNDFLNFTEKTSKGWGYAVFGQVVNGMAIVDAISKVPTTARAPFKKDVPVTNITIQSEIIIPCNTVIQELIN